MNSRGPTIFELCLRAARRRKLLVTVPALVLAVSSGFALSKAQALYQSSARILVESQSEIGTEIRGYLEKSRQLVANSDSPQARNRSSSKAQSVSIEPDSDPTARPGVVIVTCTAVDPETAQSAATETADLLVSQSKKEPSPASKKLDPLRARAAELSVRVRELEQAYPWLTDSRSRGPSTSAPEPLRSSQPSVEMNRAQQMTIESLNDQRYKFQQQLTDME